MQMGFHFNQSRCIGCHTCSIACKDWHDIQAEPVNWRRVATIEEGKYPDVFVAFLSLSCCHCAQPACVEVCPMDAITKRLEDGIIMVDKDKCLGKDKCNLCQEACPYQIPQFGSEENAKMQMCTFCVDRLAEGKKPICVDACPVYALDFGPLDELRDKYGNGTEGAGFVYSAKTSPSIVFKPKLDK